MVESLSPQEQRVLELAAKGLTDKGIASSLEISPTTVITYWARIRSKMGHHPRPELVAHYVRQLSQSDVVALQTQVREHLREIEHLAQSVETLSSFIELAPEAMLIVHPDGVIQSGNEEAARLLECDKSDFAGLRIGRFIPPAFHEAHREHRLKYLEDPHRMEMGHAGGVEVVTFLGDRIRGSVTVNLAPTPTGEAVVVIIRKIELERKP